MRTTKIVIVEDHSIFREGLKRVIDKMNGVTLVGEAENGAVFLELLKTVKPDLVLMDIKMPVMDGVEATDKALKIYPDLRILVLSMFGEEEYLYSMVLKGISGFVLKTIHMNDLEKAIKLVAEGQQYFSNELNGLMVKKIRQFSSNEVPTFTPKETEVLHLLCKGHYTEEIANELCLSKRTVEGYRARLLEKTSTSNTLNLVLYALKNKLVPLQDIDSKD